MKKNIDNKAILQPENCKITFSVFDPTDTNWGDVIESKPFGEKKKPKPKKSDDVWAELRERTKKK